MPNLIDLGGQRFGRLLVTEQQPRRSLSGGVRWHCLCDCGGETTVASWELRSGTTVSCGCFRQETSALKLRKYRRPSEPIHGHARTSHRSAEYTAWRGMLARCYQPSSPSYKNYGARGITVCERWRNSFVSFLVDVGLKPDPRLTLDRIRNDVGYEPGNVRWATWTQQNNNRRPFRQRVRK
jgi:hypothetical protein